MLDFNVFAMLYNYRSAHGAADNPYGIWGISHHYRTE
jgi:hypothetical protein